MENISKGKFEEAKKYATESTGKLIDLIAAMGTEQVTHPDFKFKATKEEIDGDQATIYYINADGDEDEIDLIKVDGKWKVNMSK